MRIAQECHMAALRYLCGHGCSSAHAARHKLVPLTLCNLGCGHRTAYLEAPELPWQGRQLYALQHQLHH